MDGATAAAAADAAKAAAAATAAATPAALSAATPPLARYNQAASFQALNAEAAETRAALVQARARAATRAPFAAAALAAAAASTSTGVRGVSEAERSSRGATAVGPWRASIGRLSTASFWLPHASAGTTEDNRCSLTYKHSWALGPVRICMM